MVINLGCQFLGVGARECDNGGVGAELPIRLGDRIDGGCLAPSHMDAVNMNGWQM